tara:strand:+ start:470 stop:1090 length:621 start_codon:yes stop_codon:yes gene_type:complete
MKSDLKLDWCDIKAARFACLNWHYSKSVPVGKLVKVGVWENKKYIGCVLFGRGANNNMLKPFGLNADEGCELVRIALNKHENPVSKILSIALMFLKKQCPNLKLVVSYSDQDQNHHGGIYQATNWIYDGLKNAGTKGAFIIHGKKTHPKSVHSKGVKQTLSEVKKHLDPNATVFITKGKHRYLMPLTKEMKKKILPLSKPYPKRVK